MERGDFVNANDINWHIPISWVNENRNTSTRHNKTSYIIIGLLQTPNQNFKNNIIMSPSTEYLEQYHSRGIAIFMYII